MNQLDTNYQALLNDIGANGVDKKDRTGTGSRSIFGRQIRHKMSDGFPLLTTKKMYFKGIATELVWFLRGKSDLKFLLDNKCEIWVGDAYKKYCDHYAGYEGVPDRNWFIHEIMNNEQFAEKWGDLGPIYGPQWRDWNGQYTMVVSTDRDDKGYLRYEKQHHPGIDQVLNLIRELKKNPDSRRLLVNAWNPAQLSNMVLPPCHHGFQVWTRELSFDEKIKWVMSNTGVEMENLAITEMASHPSTPTRAISLMWNQRSVDVPLGLPFNIASYGLLLEILGKIFNMVPDEIIGNLGDCHIYNNQIEGIQEQLKREPFDLPSLNINTEFWMTESGSCGEGPLDAEWAIKSFFDDHFCKSLIEEDIQLWNYQCHPAIKIHLSN